MIEDDINGALYQFSDPERRKERMGRLRRSRRLVVASVGLIIVVLAARIAFIVFGSHLIVSPIVVILIGGMMLALGIAGMAMHSEYRSLVNLEAVLQLLERRINDQERSQNEIE